MKGHCLLQCKKVAIHSAHDSCPILHEPFLVVLPIGKTCHYFLGPDMYDGQDIQSLKELLLAVFIMITHPPSSENFASISNDDALYNICVAHPKVILLPGLPMGWQPGLATLTSFTMCSAAGGSF
jgi:hypothetical protein